MVIPSKDKLSGFKIFREYVMCQDPYVSKASILREWDELELGFRTNPFIYIEDVQDLLAESKEHRVFDKEEEIMVKIVASIQPDFVVPREYFMFRNVEQSLKDIKQYAKFRCAEGQVPWNPNNWPPKYTQQKRCYKCDQLGHFSKSCPQNAYVGGYGRNGSGHKSSHKKSSSDRSKPRKHFRQGVHVEGYEEIH